MTRKLTLVLATVLAILFVCSPRELFAQSSKQSESITPDKLALHSVRANIVIYRERTALRITDTGTSDLDDASRFALVRAISFQDGTIEVTLSGDTVPDAPPQLRGFVGIAFRVSADESQFECFYIRPKNGRSDDQLQRNHSAQYISIPGFPWQKLRSQTPGKYEAYVDLVPGEWTKLRIEAKGSTAKLYINGAEQPTLIVNDLKQTPAKGGIALWVGPGTIGHFTDLRVSP
jgi:hypothetical protein